MARLGRVTVRTLHHYDAIGLLTPSERSPAGYRLYTRADLERLQEILVYRELGFPLAAIAEMVDSPAQDRTAALRSQREQLLARRDALDEMIDTLSRTLTALEEDQDMSAEEMFKGFPDLTNAPDDVRAHQAEHAAEVEERWGGSDSYRESARRVQRYSKDDWARIKAENEENESRMAALLAAEVDPTSPEAMDGAEALRLHIDRWYYPCPPAAHATLADMYETDGRFKAHYERRAAGLARFIAAAIRANAAR